MQAKLPKYQPQNLQQETTANVQVKNETPLPSTAADESIPSDDILASAAQNLPVKQEADLDSLVSIPPHKKVKLEEITDSWLDDVIYCGNDLVSENPVEAEVNRYFMEQGDKSGDPLLWWKNREVLYPILSKLAKKYLAIPASSVPSERIFSLAGNLVTKKRVNLLPENVHLLIFLNKTIEK